MCGIAGEVAFRGGRAATAPVERMSEAMAKRGPDGKGLWATDRVCLGHRRLSVIDLSAAGAQPMVDEAARLALVFNGCIYNHNELRRELRRHYSFASTSDTEVVLKAYRHWGEDFVDHLVGMFAIVIADERKEKVVLARDRLGIKPLYLAESAGRLRFASTLPALLASGGIDTALDEVALHHYLSWHSIVPAPRTILRGIRKLPPATVRVLAADGSHCDRVYWKPDYVRHPEHSSWSPGDWREAIRASLQTAVRRRLVADVPVGTLLSGGLDSSLLVALLAGEGQEGLNTFSIGFDGAGGESGDEFRYSDLIAREFGTHHHRLHVPAASLVPAIGEAVAAMAEPMASHDVAAFFLLSKAVAEHVKVVLSGQGADEVFAGYAYHQSIRSVPREQVLPSFTGAFVDRSHRELAEILEPEWLCPADESGRRLAADFAAPGAESALDAVLRLDTHVLMPEDPVKRVDNMTMAWALEARVPFLDQDLVALAASCPPELKYGQGGKGVVKDLARSLLPTAVIDRPKGYFPVPALQCLQEPFLSLVQDSLRAPEAKQRGLVRPEYLEELLVNPNEGSSPGRGKTLWSLAVLEMWLQHHGVGG